ncbi:Peroxisome proliferator-activated receptor gamma coactivator-related protein 1 [Channa argus]|uniref:Peroxisome proliferator-activated receptor gamma coactivator-related protein 1 n=1 Tax=Channa argus TaxID=215402 RepID=A0A6G1R1L1_CHAAH|nr:Peroxisome proliferator-activated receptor gamma coactivator-related protein 1 [Channa argus]
MEWRSSSVQIGCSEGRREGRKEEVEEDKGKKGLGGAALSCTDKSKVFFPLQTSEETLEALQSCLDSSIISIFEDTPTIDTKGLDEESEATLLTALTEILDNVDDDNLSPFDTLPDSDLLSNQKGRDLSPLRRLLCLPCSPSEKDTLCSTRTLSTGKSLPRIQADSLQRSDGEEEEDSSLSLSPVRHESSPDDGLLDWDGLTLPLPVSFEQEGEDGLSVSLGDLVRHMHPYCMTICVENDDGEQMLPEGGILLEVVDQAETGEPILAIPDMGHSMCLAVKEQTTEDKKVSGEAQDVASDSSEHIVVDDEDLTITEAPVKVTAPATPEQHLKVKDEIIHRRQKEEIKEKNPSRRKKKKKSMEQCQPEPEEGRVLRSSTVRKQAKEAPTKSEKTCVKDEKKRKLPKVPLALAQNSSVKPNKRNPRQTEMKTKITTTTLLPKENMQTVTCVPPSQDTVLLNDSAEKNQSSRSSNVVIPQQPGEAKEQLVPALEKLGDSSSVPSAVLPPLSLDIPAAVSSPPPVGQALPPVAPVVSEPKPKLLSLEEYRRLRQQKKPTPVEKQDNSSTKWPSLPELPKELPPIPCLPDPSPSDRRPNPNTVKKEVKEIRPWQPRGPAAPPTPEALLVPPAYMIASSSKVSATTVSKPEQIPEPSKPSSLQKPLTSAPVSGTSLPSHQHTTAQPSESPVPRSSGSPALLNQVSQVTSSADEMFSLAPLGEKSEVDKRPTSQNAVPKSTELITTTTEVIKHTAATASVKSAPQKTTVFQKVPEVVAAIALNNPIPFDSRSSKSTLSVSQLSSSPLVLTSKTQTPKVEPVVLETKEKPTTALKSQKTKNPTQELIEAFTSEIGIEAADLTSLLEQFEETQAAQRSWACVAEIFCFMMCQNFNLHLWIAQKSVLQPMHTKVNVVSVSIFLLAKRASERHCSLKLLFLNFLFLANSFFFNLAPEKMVVERMWRPLAPVALLGKSKAMDKPLPGLACMDHDYCLPYKVILTEESGKHCNVKPKSFITIRPIKQPLATTTQTPPAALMPSVQLNPVVISKTHEFQLSKLRERTEGMQRNSALDTPDASPTRQETNSAVNGKSPRRRPSGRPYRRHAASHTPSPRSSPKERTGGRSRKRCHRSPSPISSGSESDSHSSRSRSRSYSPSKKRYHSRLSESSSSSSSRSSSRSSPSVSCSPPRRRKYSYSSSRSGSWSRSRSRSRSPHRRAQWSRSRRFYSPSYNLGYGHSAKINVEEVKRRKERAIEERRVVYVGRIQSTMTQKELKERFSLFGEIEDCTLHFRDYGDNYGFVTYYNTKDAFTAIENGSKLRNPDELPFDLCFGGRRQFCQSGYSDLDSNREFEPVPAKSNYGALDFDTLLKQAQQNLKR